MAAMRSVIVFIILLKVLLMIYLITPGKTDFAEEPLLKEEKHSENLTNEEHLIDFVNFSYTIEQPSCGVETQGLILIHTAPDHFGKRSVIRETWGNFSSDQDSPLRLIFALGAVQNDSLQTSLIEEQTLFGDLLQGNFMDTYVNITYKHVMVLKWFNSHCNHAKLLMKIDDDIFVNTRLLLDNLMEQVEAPKTILSYTLRRKENVLLCSKNPNPRVIRSYKSKWRVSFKEYPDSHYPDFCPGFTVIYSPDVAKRLYEEVQQSPYFRLDDVYITGIMSKRANITITDLKPYILYPGKTKIKLMSGEVPVSAMELLVSWHQIEAKEMRTLWTLFAGGQ
ncbi:hypothetical protein KR059_003086 [Drosophila kikkawai]|nr:hypothetical protein KR059_003086 [Drosophila kikkawai]